MKKLFVQKKEIEIINWLEIFNLWYNQTLDDLYNLCKGGLEQFKGSIGRVCLFEIAFSFRLDVMWQALWDSRRSFRGC